MYSEFGPTEMYQDFDNDVSDNDVSDNVACTKSDPGCSNPTQLPACAANVTSVSQSMCEQADVMPKVIESSCPTVKIPVVIAEANITIPVEAVIRLEGRALEVKRIKKIVYLTQCHLLPFSTDKSHPCTGIVFISGFVRKNIEYATRECMSSGVESGRINHTTVEVPFRCTTRVRFLSKPVFEANFNQQEIEFFEDTLSSCNPCADAVIGRNPCEQDFFQVEMFNEKPFCELVKAVISEADIHRDATPVGCENPTEQTFCSLTEKMVINLTVKILQNQQVKITSLGPVPPPKKEC